MTTLTLQQALGLQPQGKTTLTLQEALALPAPTSGVTIAPKGGVPREATQAELGENRSSLSVFGENLNRQFINNVLGIPSAVADAFTINPLSDARALIAGEAPQPVIGNVPRVTLSDVGLDISPEQQAAQAAQFPTATTAGQVGGDILTLLTGRAGLGLKSAGKVATPVVPGLEGAAIRGMNRIKRGAGKALSVGIEGAALATLNEGDPVKAAGAAAGAQAAGSLAITIAKIPTTKMGLLASIGGLAALIQTWKSLTPGGRDRVLESAESAVSKIGLSMMVGGAATLAGAGRVRGEMISAKLPRLMDRIADTVNVGLRGPWISYWSGFKKNESELDAVESRLQEFMASPENITPAQQRKIQKAINSGDFNELRALVAP